MISEGIKNVSEVGILVTASGVLIGSLTLMLKKLLSDSTNKEVIGAILELKDEMTVCIKFFPSDV